MDTLDPPPSVDVLRAAEPAIFKLTPAQSLVRIWFANSRHLTGFAHFRTFGPTCSRFDHHIPDADGGPMSSHLNGTDFSILYAIVVPDIVGALDSQEDNPSKMTREEHITAAVGEVFQSSRIIDLTTDAPHLSIFNPTQDLSLLDLTGFWTTRIGASANLSSGPRHIARAWSRALHEAYPEIDGLLYRSSMSGGQCLATALYERATASMPHKARFGRALTHPTLRKPLVSAAKALGYDILV